MVDVLRDKILYINKTTMVVDHNRLGTVLFVEKPTAPKDVRRALDVTGFTMDPTLRVWKDYLYYKLYKSEE